MTRAANGQLRIDTELVPLADIEDAWQRQDRQAAGWSSPRSPLDLQSAKRQVVAASCHKPGKTKHQIEEPPKNPTKGNHHLTRDPSGHQMFFRVLTQSKADIA